MQRKICGYEIINNGGVITVITPQHDVHQFDGLGEARRYANLIWGAYGISLTPLLGWSLPRALGSPGK